MSVIDIILNQVIPFGILTLMVVVFLMAASSRPKGKHNQVRHIADELCFDRSKAHGWVRQQHGEFLVLKATARGFTLRLRMRGVGLTLAPTLFPRSVGGDALGDPDFDARWALRGLKGHTITCLHPAARAALATAPPEVMVMGGWLVWNGNDVPGEAAEALRVLQHLQLLLEDRPSLGAFIAGEPTPPIKATALDALFDADPVEAQQIASQLPVDPEPGVEARLAILTNDNERKLAVLQHLNDPELALRVVEAMGAFTTMSGIEVLASRDEPAFDAVAMRAMRHLTSEPAVALARILALRLAENVDTHGPFLAELYIAATLVIRVHDPTFDLLPFWLVVLSRGSKNAKPFALKALGAQATVEVVPAIREMQEQLGLLDVGLKQAADLAVRQIQARVTGGHGGLALAGTSASGMVSLPDPQTTPGGVSLFPQRPKRHE